jgi:acetoin utilization deacetylase AcuC-like enzyme
LLHHADSGVFKNENFIAPIEANENHLLEVHTPEYLESLKVLVFAILPVTVLK